MRHATVRRSMFVISALVLGCFVLAPGQVQAGTIVVYELRSDHCTGTCGTPPFGTVTLEQLVADVKVTVSIDDPGETALLFVKTGPGVASGQTFLFNGTGVVLADISIAAHSPALGATAGPYSTSFGTFAFGIECPTCANGASGGFSSDIIFTVAGATIADLTGGTGARFAADIQGGNGLTGLVDATEPHVPDGGLTLTLLGGALVGLGVLRWKFRA